MSFCDEPSLRVTPKRWRKWVGWKRRTVLAILKAVDEPTWCDAWYGSLSGCVVADVRRLAKEVTGGNMTFADDDVHLLAFLANKAAEADLVDGLHPDMVAAIRSAVAARKDGSSPKPSPPQSGDTE